MINEMEISAEKASEEGTVSSKPTTKQSIIEYELNRHGVGRYHRCIWGICGAGFMLDLMWSQSFSILLLILQREFGFSDSQLGNLGAAYVSGLIIGAFVWGSLVDIVGRKVAFYGTSLISGAFGMALGAMNSFGGVLAISLLVGFGIGGNIPIDSTITVEYLPKNKFYMFTALAFFAQIGYVIITAIALAFIPNFSCSPELVSCHLTKGVEPCCSKAANMGWRYVFFTISSLTLCVFVLRFFIFPFYESPKFLITKGKDHAAVEVVRKVASFNKFPCDLTVESLHQQCDATPVVEKIPFFKRLANERARLKVLFGSWKMIRVTILIWIIWIFDYWSVGIANTYLPTILQRKNIAVHIGLKQTYVDYLIISTPGVLATVIAVLMVRVPRIGRKWTLVFASIIMGISPFLYSIINTEASRIGFNMLMTFFQLIFNAVLWGWTPEAFPTEIRGTAAGLAMVLATLVTVTGPIVTEQIFKTANGSNIVLYMAGGGVFVCTIALLCLPAKDMVWSGE